MHNRELTFPICLQLVILFLLLNLAQAAEISSNLRFSSSSQESHSQFSLHAKKALSGKIIALASAGIDKKLTGLQELELTNGTFGLNSKQKLHQHITLSGATQLVLPLNQDQRELDSFRGAIELASRLQFHHKGSSIHYQLGGRISSYSYKTNRYGSPNSTSSLTHTIGANFHYKRLLLDISFSNTHRYSDDRLSDIFSLQQTLAYQVNRKLSLAVGHQNGGSTFHANGVDPNVEIYDPESSLFYTTLTYQL